VLYSQTKKGDKMRKPVTYGPRSKCAWAGCESKQVGRSKYCRSHRIEAKQIWLSKVRESYAKQAENRTPVQTETGGTFYPAGYFRFASKLIAYQGKLENVSWGIEVTPEGRPIFHVRGKNVLTEVDETETL